MFLVVFLPYSTQDGELWGADVERLKRGGWTPIHSGPSANSIHFQALTVKVGQGSAVGRPMPKLDVLHKLAHAMVKADLATRKLREMWAKVVSQEDHAFAMCGHPKTHLFPPLPLLFEGSVLFNFPVLELCVVCGMTCGAYPGAPHRLRNVGYDAFTDK